MNLWRKFEAVVKPWMLIVTFILLLLFGFYKEAKAEVTLEIGPTFLSGDYSKGGIIMLRENFDNHYSIGLGYIYKQEVIDRHDRFYAVDENLFIQGQRHVDLGNWDLALGVAYFNATNRALGSKFTAALSIGYEWDSGFGIHLRHWSNAGSGWPNMGQDALTFAWSFQ